MAIELGDDTLDSRAVNERIEELEDSEETLREAREELEELQDDEGSTQEDIDAAKEAVESALVDFTGADANELRQWKELRDELAGYCPDWDHGTTLVEDSHFTDYAKELAEDIGAVNSDAGWPNRHIDWDAAADELKQDYTPGEVDGWTYWAR